MGYFISSTLTLLSYFIIFRILKKDERLQLFSVSSFSDLLIKTTSPFVDHKLVVKITKFFQEEISLKILKEGEKYLLVIFYILSYEEQGILYLIYLFESLFSLIIFSTIEQISYDYFQQKLLIKNYNSILFKQTNNYKSDYKNNQNSLKQNGIYIE